MTTGGTPALKDLQPDSIAPSLQKLIDAGIYKSVVCYLFKYCVWILWLNMFFTQGK